MAFKDWLKEYRESQSAKGTNSVESSETTFKTSEKSTSGSSVGGNSGAFRSWLAEYREKQSTGSVEGWAEASINLLNDTKERTAKWFDSAEQESLSSRYTSLLAQADGWRKQHTGNNEALAYIDSVADALSKAKGYTWDRYQAYSKWKSAEEYDKDIQNQKEYEELLDFDTDFAEKEIKSMEQALAGYGRLAEYYHMYQANPEAYSDNESVKKMAATYEQYQQMFGSQEDLEKRLHDTKLKLSNAKRLQEGVRLSSVADRDSEFDKYSGYVSTEFDDAWSKLWSQYGMGYDDLTYEYINGGQSGMREEIIRKNIVYNADGDSLGDTLDWKVYDHMTEDEISIYNYYYAKHGKEAAENYLDYLKESLNYRVAEKRFGSLKDNTVLELIFGVEAGLDQFESGVKNLLNTSDNYVPATSTQMVSGMVREDLADDGVKLPEWMGGASLGQVGYDAITTTTNMAPSILTATVVGTINPNAGAAVGNALMGASAAGNAYQEALNLGYNKEQARAYSTLIGASEVGLQYLMGGIGKLGGKLSGKAVASLASKFDNAYARLAVQYGSNMLSEGAEEYLQEILTPVFKNVALGTDEEIELITEEAIYSFLLGAVTSGFMEFTGISSENGKGLVGNLVDMSTKNQANVDAVNLYGSSIKELIDEGLASETGSKSHQFAEVMKRKMDKGRSVSGYEIRQLVEANETQFAAEDSNTAEEQQNVLNQATQTDRAAKLFDIPYRSSEGQSDFSKASRTNSAEQSTEIAATEGNLTVSENVAAERALDSPAQDDVTRQVSTGKKVTPQKVTQINGKQVMVEVDSGDIVAADDIEFGTEAEDLLWRTTLSIQNITPTAANTIIQTAKLSNMPSSTYTSSAAVVFQNGYHNTQIDPEYGGRLTDVQRDIIYEAGRLAAQENTAKEQAKREANSKASNKKTAAGKSSATAKKGAVYYGYEGQTMADRKSSGKELDAKQSVGVDFAERLAKSRGMTFYFYESYIDEDGNRVYKDKNGNIVKAENGFYDPSDGSIHIDLNAGDGGKGTVLFTISHELVHFIKDWSLIHFNRLADLIVNRYTEKDIPVDTLVQVQQSNAQEQGRELTYGEAYEEMIADSMEGILADGKVMELLGDIEKTDKTLGDKIREFFQDIVQLLKDTINAYRGVEPDSIEGRLVSQMNDLVTELQQVFAEGIYEAGDNYLRVDGTISSSVGKRYSLLVKQTNGTERKVNPATITKDEILNYIVMSRKGQLENHTYFPVRTHTPSTIIATLRNAGIMIEDKPLAMQAIKARQAQKDESYYTKEGALVRGHAMTAYEIIEAIDKLEKPEAVIYETAREKTVVVDGRKELIPLPDAFVVVVTLDNGKECVAVLEFDSEIDSKYLIRDGNGDQYHTTITVFEPDVTMDGLPYDYIEFLVSKETNYELDIIKESSKTETAHSEILATVSEKELSEPKITQYGKDVKENLLSNSDKPRLSSRRGTAQFALEHFGRTYSWKETGYLLTDGSKLDFSGRHEGATGGYRSVDHREILDVYPEDTEFDGNGAMVDFMSQGNIRIMPEGDGINLQVQPTKAQERALDDFISRARGEVTLDLDDTRGNTVVSVEYPRGTRATKVLQDIRNYFENGTEPVISELAKFYYSARKNLNTSVEDLLQKENAKLKEDVQYLKDLLKLQRTGTGGTKFTKSSVEVAARMLKQSANAKGDTTQLAKLLNNFYEQIATNKELTWETVKELAQPAVDWLQSNVNIKPERSEYVQDILSFLRTSRIYLDESQVAETAYRYGSFNDYRKMMMGSVIIAKDGAVSLDTKWNELATLYPDVFDIETSAADQPEALMNAINMLRNSDTSALEYEYNRKLITQDLLRQVYDSYWRVSTLYTVADVKQREINQLKAQHYQRMDKLRTDNAAKIEKIKADHRKKVADIRQQFRERMDTQQREITQRYQESRKKGIESRQKTEMRHKIQKVVKRLNDLLLKESKEKHIPESMKDAVAEALDLINMDTVGAEDRIAKYDALLAQATDPDVIASLTESRERIAKAGARLSERIASLKAAYDSIKNEAETGSVSVYDEGIASTIQEVAEKVGKTALRDMSLEQLEMVYEMYTMITKSISVANKAFKDARGHTITEMSTSAIREIKAVGGNRQYAVKALESSKKFGWNLLKPYYAFSLIGSDTMSRLYENVRKGEDIWAADVEEARRFFRENAAKYGYDNWDMEQSFSFQDVSGREFTVALPQILSLYAYSKRAQADKHLEKGGLVFDSDVEVTQRKHGIPVKYKVNTANAYNLTRDTIDQIVATLTDDQVSFVDVMQEYLSSTLAEKGNEVSLALYDVRLFKEKNYFPLKSASQYMFKQTENTGEVKLKNSGFSKGTTPHASNPIILSGFMDVWGSHVNDMSMYHAFVLPLEDFNRVYNYKTPTTEDTSTVSVKGTLQNAYGAASNKYIQQLLEDINGGARTDDRADFVNKWMGKFKKGSVFANASVVIQQPSAIARAAALIEVQHFIGPKIGERKQKVLWEEVKKYAPVAIIKEMGYFDTNMGRSTVDYITAKEYSTLGEKAKAIVTDENYRDELLSRPAALADEISWVYIWEAVKRETKANNPDISIESDAFLMKAGERFTEVVTRTQVYDSVLSRSGLMRAKDTGAKMVMSFMAEPTTSMNMVFDALIQSKRGDRRYGRTAIGAVIASQILNSLLVSLVYAARDDDEEKTYLEKYIASFVGKSLDSLNPLTYIPFIKDILSIARGHTVERSDMAVINDLVTAWHKLSNPNVSVYRKVEEFGGSVAQLFGLPLKNIMRDVRAIGQTTASFFIGEDTTGAGIGVAIAEAVTGVTISNDRQLYEAYRSRNTEQIQRVEARYADRKAINSALQRVIREEFGLGNLTENEAIKLLVSYGVKEQDKAESKVQHWAFQAAYPDYDISESAVRDFYEYAEPAGIKVEVYYDYCQRKSGCTKKVDIMGIIDDLPITKRQKDALYYAEGWAESTIDDAPWH